MFSDILVVVVASCNALTQMDFKRVANPLERT